MLEVEGLGQQLFTDVGAGVGIPVGFLVEVLPIPL